MKIAPSQIIDVLRSPAARFIRAGAFVAASKLSLRAGLRLAVTPNKPANAPTAGDLGQMMMGCASLSAGWSARTPSARRAFEMLDRAAEAGCRAFDTAAAYSGGGSDRALGAWIAARGARDTVTIIAKGGHPDTDGNPRLDTDFLRDDLYTSLDRLDVDWVDYYILHRDDPDRPVASIMETLHTLVQEGVVAELGASNWTHDRIEEANRHARRHGLTPFTASSPHMSLAEMYEPPWPGCLSITGEANAPARRWYEATQMPVLAWSPLSGGALIEATANRPSANAYRGNDNVQRRKRLESLAATRGHSAAQIALAYLLHQPARVIPIVSASTPDRLGELFAASTIELTPAEITWLELASDHPERTAG